MAAAQHTQGPWEIQREGELARIFGGPDGRFVARVEGASGEDAHLIAEAPELLSELRNTTFLLMSACLVMDDAYARETALAAVKCARAAIAKATGRAA
jgi:hypothetical protein